jgi:hypothetical protein
MNYPQIIENSWGFAKVLFNDEEHLFGKPHTNRADLILAPNHMEQWNWKDPTTLCDTHDPGISQNAIDYLIKLGCDTIILCRGRENNLQTKFEVLEYAKNRHLTVHHLTTPDAILKWNTLTNNPNNTNKIGLLLHSTC